MRHQPADRARRSVFRRLSLPQRSRLVLGADLNRSESRRWPAADHRSARWRRRVALALGDAVEHESRRRLLNSPTTPATVGGNAALAAERDVNAAGLVEPPCDGGMTRPPTEAASDIFSAMTHIALLRQAFNGEGTEFRVLVANLPSFFVLG
jgi:hypothetical protein